MYTSLSKSILIKLFQISEAVHSPSNTGVTFNEGKRIRLESPVALLLASVQHQTASNVRSYHLQTLLFFIDRHWLILHSAIQQEVIQTLLQFVSLDDTIIQSWVFLCFAAIAYADSSRVYPSSLNLENTIRLPRLQTEDSAIWDSIWTNAIRRVNVPTVSRAACHAAYAILAHVHAQGNGLVHIPLASQRVLAEIETLAKDLDVQGPPYPYDSVCTFLSCCLKVASQDMRLYRMQLEEKALSWLLGCWKVVGIRRKALSLHMVDDLMLLLESICGLAKRSGLISRVPLPECLIVEILVEEAKTKVIKDFLLAARLPKFCPVGETWKNDSPSFIGIATNADTTKMTKEAGLAQPQGRERRVSTFLLKSLEYLLSEWEEDNGHPTAEVTRRSLDMAVTALSFESILVLNGTQSNRRLMQCACKLIGIVTTLLTDPRWTPAERVLVYLGLDPLTLTGREFSDEHSWDAMLPPDIGSGIRTQSLCRLVSAANERGSLRASRMHFLRILWQNTDVFFLSPHLYLDSELSFFYRSKARLITLPAHYAMLSVFCWVERLLQLETWMRRTDSDPSEQLLCSNLQKRTRRLMIPTHVALLWTHALLSSPLALLCNRCQESQHVITT